MVQKCRTRSNDYEIETEPPEQPYLPVLHVPERRTALFEHTGILAANGRPMLRMYPPSNPIGFLAELDEDADGETYFYVEGDDTPSDG